VSAIYHFLMRMPGLRRLTLSPPQAPGPTRTCLYSFTKEHDGASLTLVLDVNGNHATETITKGSEIVKETITPIGPEGLADWYTRRCAELLDDGWKPVAVTPPLDVPTHP